MIKGIQSIEFEKPPYIVNYASIVGKKEGDGPLGSFFDVIEKDPMLGMSNWEEAESELQRRAVLTALSFLRRSFRSDYRLFLRNVRVSDSNVWPLRCLFNRRGILITCCNDCCRRLCR